MKKSSKKGLSEVITTLIIIGVSLLGITMIWVVIRNVITSGSEEIDIGKFVVDLDMQKVQVNPNGIDVTVKRNVGQGSLKEISFVISDGTNTQIFKQPATLEELGRQTFSINYSGPIKSIAIAPISSSGSQGGIADTLEFSGYEAAKNMFGLVSWWKMEGNANDEMGLNNGNLSDPAPQLVDGKHGKAYRFFDISNMIKAVDSQSLQLENSNMTIITWINKTLAGAYAPIVSKGDVRGHAEPGYFVGTTFVSSTKVKPGFGTSNFSVEPNYNITTKTWNHLAFSQSVISTSRTLRFYDNGQLINQTSKSGVNVTSSVGYDLLIGIDNDVNFGAQYESFAGTIDEVMIFNRTLTDSEIAGLYALELS